MVKKEKLKKEQNNNVLKALFGALGILVLSIVLLLLFNLVVPFQRFNPNWLVRNYFVISILFTSLVGILSLYLIFIYLKDYFELKSKFTLGIILTATSFLLFAITSNPLLCKFLGVYGKGGGGLFSLIPMCFALISLAVLVWISSK